MANDATDIPAGPHPPRLMRPDEVGEVSRVIVSAIRAGFRPSYPADVIEAVVEGNRPEAVRKRSSKQADYVLSEGGGIVAMVGLKRNEIGHLFVDPAHARRGFGRRLVDFARDRFRSAGHREMVVLASLNAVGFYQRCGFRAEGNGDLPVGEGLRLEYVKMKASIQDS